jgi:hypothetical protein
LKAEMYWPTFIIIFLLENKYFIALWPIRTILFFVQLYFPHRVQEEYKSIAFHPLIHMRITKIWKNWAVQFNPVYWFFFQRVLCISFYVASSTSLLYLWKYVISAVCFSWWLKFRISLKLKAKAKLYWQIFLHVKFIVENALCWLEYCI